jgi:hypothetical protein
MPIQSGRHLDELRDAVHKFAEFKQGGRATLRGLRYHSPADNVGRRELTFGGPADEDGAFPQEFRDEILGAMGTGGVYVIVSYEIPIAWTRLVEQKPPRERVWVMPGESYSEVTDGHQITVAGAIVQAHPAAVTTLRQVI